jgi:hypothetical protein
MAPHSQRIDIVSLDVEYKTINEIQTPDTICLLLNAACCQRGLGVAVRLVRVVLLMDDSLPVDKLLSAGQLLSVEHLLSASYLLSVDTLLLLLVDHFPSGDC